MTSAGFELDERDAERALEQICELGFADLIDEWRVARKAGLSALSAADVVHAWIGIISQLR